MRHFITIADCSAADLRQVLDRAFALRRQRQAGIPAGPVLAGKTVAMIFEKPSLRTRVSFEQALLELGGAAIVLSGPEVGIGKREPAADIARVLSGMVQGIVARVNKHQTLVDMAQHASVPVVNALSDLAHPCQALADAMTLMDEFGPDLTGRTLAFIGDGNNVARSLALVCGRLGMNFHLAAPAGYELSPAYLERLRGQAPGVNIQVLRDPLQAVADADAVYTDTWISMGQEHETASRQQAFKGFQINAQLLAAAPPHAIVLHCLPAYRGHEITQDVLEGPRSRVFPQAHNRLHAQKGLLAVLMGGGNAAT